MTGREREISEKLDVSIDSTFCTNHKNLLYTEDSKSFFTAPFRAFFITFFCSYHGFRAVANHTLLCRLAGSRGRPRGSEYLMLLLCHLCAAVFVWGGDG